MNEVDAGRIMCDLKPCLMSWSANPLMLLGFLYSKWERRRGSEEVKEEAEWRFRERGRVQKRYVGERRYKIWGVDPSESRRRNPQP